MSEWREQIVRRLVPGVARVTAVSDPDGILRDPDLFQSIQARGFAISPFEDSVSFRFDYESRFRVRWDVDQTAELVVVFKPGEYEFETLPADVLAEAQRLSFSLKDIFPRLSYEIVSQIETTYFDALFRAQQQYASQVHDAPQTQGFVLRHVFGIEPTVIKSVPDLMRMLCQLHYTRVSIPPQLNRYLTACLEQNQNFKGWPLEVIISSRAAFWDFLNERWPIYVRQTNGDDGEHRQEPQRLKHPGPTFLPFGHDEVRGYIENLFDDGVLTPVEWDWSQAPDEKWIRVGLLGNKIENTELRFSDLSENLIADCPDKSATPQAWLAYSFRYAQANVLWTQTSPATRARYQAQFPALRRTVNEHFQDWLTTFWWPFQLPFKQSAHGPSHSGLYRAPVRQRTMQARSLHPRGRPWR